MFDPATLIAILLPQVVLFAATGLALLGFLWLVLRAFETGWGWGLGVLVCPPLALVYAGHHGRAAREPLAWTLTSGLVALGTWLLAFRPRPFVLASELVGQYILVEQTAVWAVLAGAVLVLVGFLALIIEGFLTRWYWGLGLLVFPPLALVFAARHWRRARWPLLTILLGGVVGAAPVIATRYYPIDLGERERIVEGERHLTLTGWDRASYALLRQKPDLVVLQMANRDVTDATLNLLEGMDRLRELDLSDTQITDAGLATLARLPALETLRLSRTQITDAGFQTHLAPLTTLKQIDLRETAVAPETVQAWRRERPGRRALR